MNVTNENLAAALGLRLADQVAINSEDLDKIAFVLYQALVGRRELCEELWDLGVIEEEYFV